MAALGSTVTMLVRGDSLLTGYEPFAGQHVREALEAAGVTIRFGTEAVSASRPEAAGGGDVGRLHGGPDRDRAERRRAAGAVRGRAAGRHRPQAAPGRRRPGERGADGRR